MTKDKMFKKKIYNQCSEIVICIYVPFLVISCLPLFILFNLKNKKNKWGVHPPLLLVKIIFILYTIFFGNFFCFDKNREFWTDGGSDSEKDFLV